MAIPHPKFCIQCGVSSFCYFALALLLIGSILLPRTNEAQGGSLNTSFLPYENPLMGK